eukprot:jgi/Psemu1/285432/fgenesh1_pg.87_\
MIRRRASNSLVGASPSVDHNEIETIDKKDYLDHNNNNNNACCCHQYRFLSSFTFVTVAVAAFVILVIRTSNYLDSIVISTSTSIIDPLHKPNNRTEIGSNTNSSTTIGTTKNHDPESESEGGSSSVAVASGSGSASSNIPTLAISDIPYIRHEPKVFKSIKARMDYAIAMGEADNPNNANITSGQYLLDFGIIGFPKCGTTTMMKWLNMHDHMAVLDFEITALQKYHPSRILHYIIRDLPEGRYRRGYKSPTDVEDGRARNKLGIHYGKTKLLVGLRHPVLWYESFFNHRIQNGYVMPDLMEEIYASNSNTSKSSVRTDCHGMWKGVCFNRGDFHFVLAKWGKTPLLFLPPSSGRTGTDGIDERFNFTNYNKDDEFALFSKRDKKELQKDIGKIDISPNPMFLYDVSQLRMPPAIVDDNERDNNEEANNYYNKFVLSLQSFLGVPQNVSAMPAMIRESPGKKEGINATEQLRRNGLKIDLCDEKYEIPRKWLLEIGSNVHLWIENYFVKSPHSVFPGGSVGSAASSQFLKIIQSYGEDPCPERTNRQKRKS